MISTVHSQSKRYLHDEEEEEDEEDADIWMKPRSRATQAGWSRRSWDFGPGEIVKKGVNALSGHQLWAETNTLIKRSVHMFRLRKTLFDGSMKLDSNNKTF